MPTPVTPPPAKLEALSVADQRLAFYFSPDLGHTLHAKADSLPYGTDAWALAMGYISVTPLKAAFAGIEEGGCGWASEDGQGFEPGKIWS